MRHFFTFIIALATFVTASAQTEVTTPQAKTLYKDVTKKRVSVHDPSVVYEPASGRYYIFGSHRGCAYTTDMISWTGSSFKWKTASSNDASNAEAFVTPEVTKVTKGGQEYDMPAFNAMEWSARSDANYNIDGNMWAPDVIWNPTMRKWCMYLSINGDAWHSSIILLTSNSITGPYQYQAPVVICGFQDNGHSYKGTDLELVLGTQSSLPSRYNVGSAWGNRWPHTIDPAVFYDEEGQLWLTYGSWSGGIWMLQLDETTGLRDYDVTYPSTNGSSDGVTSDPYFGTKIAGGYYVSGEGPYIEHIGNYYYLFVSYGFYSPNGGYEMRVFRSDKPNGPYKDALGRSAIFTSRVKNYGSGAYTQGEKIMGSYGEWGFMTTGECAQGHNSIIAANDGRTYLVYHTKFNDGNPDAGYHSVRVHQVFQNKNGWLVASPFEYNGDTTTDADIASKETIDRADIPGTYHLLVHKYKMDYEKMEEVKPVDITLNSDGTLSGAYTGTWSVEEGTGYLTIKLSTVTYYGVIVDQQMDYKSMRAVAFSAMSNSGSNIWGYKYRPDYDIAWQVNNQKVPVIANQAIRKNVDLYGNMPLLSDNITLKWTSSNPEVISEYGKYYPIGLQENTPVELTARLSSGNYFWQQTYTVNAMSEDNAKTTSATWQDGMVAHYTFDDEALANSLDATQQAQLKRNGTTALPTLDSTEKLRNGNTLHLNFGANGKESYAAIPNPLKGKQLENGATISMLVKRNDNNLWDALLGLANSNTKLFLTGNLYAGYNDGTNYLDINHPNTVETGKLGVGAWNMVTLLFSRTANNTTGGITIYVNTNKSSDKYDMKINGTTSTSKAAFDYGLIVDHLAACDELWLGCGSFWGSANVHIDDVIVYDRALSLAELYALNQMTDRADVDGKTDGITVVETPLPTRCDAIYDLNGCLISQPTHGIYIKNGKKIVVR